MVLCENPTPSPKIFSHPRFRGGVLGVETPGHRHTLKLLYAVEGTFVLARETEARVVGKKLISAECWAWSSTSQQTSEVLVQTRRPRCKGVRPLIQDHPVKAKAVGGTMAPTNDLPGFVPEKH